MDIASNDRQNFEEIAKSQLLPRACCNIFIFTAKVNIKCHDDDSNC